jgi:hypothetical protein
MVINEPTGVFEVVVVVVVPVVDVVVVAGDNPQEARNRTAGAAIKAIAEIRLSIRS